MPEAIKTIALTGSTGFIGQHIIQQARLMGFNIKALCRQPQAAQTGVTWVIGDLHNTAALKALVSGVDGIIHTAGLVKALNWDEFERINIEGSANLAKAILNLNTKTKPHTVHFSSLAAREPQLSNYARSKNLSEQVMQALLGVDENTPLTILRPPAVYGPLDKELLPIIKAIKNGFLPILGDKENRFSMIYATDLAIASLKSLWQVEAYGQNYELDDGNIAGYKMEEFGAIASDIFARPLRKILIPNWFLKTIGYIGNVKASITRTPSMLTSLKANELSHPNWVCAHNRLNSTSFWQAETSLRHGLEKSINWYKKERHL
jgi:nucleoside-diphosphate-sugar epimerase